MKHSTQRPRGWLLALLIFVTALVPRAFALNSYVTPDEPNWVFRTLHFSAALARGEWAATAQAGHPGVTTMWLGSLGIAVGRAVDPGRTAEAMADLFKLDRLTPENVDAYRRIGVFLDWARLPIIVTNALGVVGAFILAHRLFGRRTAVLAALMLALDPFVAGLGSLLHVDGLLATFSFLSVLSLINGLAPTRSTESPFVPRRTPLIWFAVAGFFSSLATLSKSPAVFLIPFTGLSLAAAVLIRRVTPRDAIIRLAAFVLVYAAFFILLYPALWSNPSSALGLMLERAAHHAATATRPTFFDGQADLNHGLAFYPLALSYRLSPATVIGLALAGWFVVFRRQFARPREPMLLVVLTFSLTFVAFLAPAAKKFDRYLLPAIPPLVLIASWGIDQLTRASTGRLVAAPHFATVALQVIMMLSASPYLLMVYNPVLGGAAGASARIAVGWGEGFGAGAQWIAGHAPGATIATGGLSNVAPLYSGRVVTIDPAGLATADYVVFTVSEVQLYPDYFGELARRGRLVHAVRIGGIDAAWIYANAQSADQADWLSRETRPDDAILLDAPTPLTRALAGVIVLPPDATPDVIADRLSALASSQRIVYVSTPAASILVQRDIRAGLRQFARLDSEAQVAGGRIQVYTPTHRAAVSLDPFTVQFDGALALIGLQPLTGATAFPDPIQVAARWRVLESPTENYSVTLDLVDTHGDSWATLGGPLRSAADFAPVDWLPGDVVDQVFSVQASPELVPGDFRLRFSADRPDGSRAGLISASGRFSGTAPILASLKIDPARQLADPAALAMRVRIEHAWPGADLVGVDVLDDAPATGDYFLVTLHWRSKRDGLDPASELRWRLESGPNQFEWTTPLVPIAAAPFRAGDLFAARYAQRLPLNLPDGSYELSLSFEDEAVVVASITVAHRDRTVSLPDSVAAIGSLGTFDFFLTQPVSDSVDAGANLAVHVAMRARDVVSVNYTVYAHLLDATGRVVAQVDTWPQGGAWPTVNWVRDQVVEDVYFLNIPRDALAGDYTLAFGVYDSLDGAQLPVRDVNGQDVPGGQLILETPVRIGAP